MDNILSDLSEKAAEQLEHTGKAARAAIKGVGKSAKGQITGSGRDQTKGTGGETQGKSGTTGKVDTEITGKPIPSKKVLAQLSQATAQLQAVKLKKIREELARQRMKTSEPASSGEAGSGQAKGPEVPVEKPKPKEDIVTKTLRGSKSTGEFKGLVGG